MRKQHVIDKMLLWRSERSLTIQSQAEAHTLSESRSHCTRIVLTPCHSNPSCPMTPPWTPQCPASDPPTAP